MHMNGIIPVISISILVSTAKVSLYFLKTETKPIAASNKADL